MSDNRLQEIITRAVVGRTERTVSWCHRMASDDMTQVLGLHISKCDVDCETEEGQTLVQLLLHVDLWCSNGDETKVLRARSRSLQEVPIRLTNEILGDADSHVMLVSGPRSVGVRVEGDLLYIDFEATVQVEVHAVTRLWIASYEMDLSPFTGDWDLSDYSGESGRLYGSH